MKVRRYVLLYIWPQVPNAAVQLLGCNLRCKISLFQHSDAFRDVRTEYPRIGDFAGSQLNLCKTHVSGESQNEDGRGRLGHDLPRPKTGGLI